MALVIRRYVEAGPGDPALQQFVDPSAVAVKRFPSPVCDIQIDDAAGNFQTLDDYMKSLGYHFQAVVAPGPLPQGYIRQLQVQFTSVSQVTITPGAARDSTNAENIILSAPAIVDITLAGAGGLDVGVEAAATWYFVYLIGDSNHVNPTAGILSISAVAPTLPAGYDVFRRIGSVRNTPGSNFRDFFVAGTGEYRVVQYRDSLTTRQQLTGGAAIAVTAIACGTVIPSTAVLGRFQFAQRGVPTVNFYDDPTQPLANPQRTLLGVANNTAYDAMRVSATQQIAYANALVGGLVDVWVTGYEEAL